MPGMSMSADGAYADPMASSGVGPLAHDREHPAAGRHEARRPSRRHATTPAQNTSAPVARAVVDAGDRVTGPRGLGIAGGRDDDRDRGSRDAPGATCR